MSKVYSWRKLNEKELTRVYLDEMRRDFPPTELKPLSMILNSEAPTGQMSKILLFLLIGIGVSFPIMSVFFCNCAHRPFHLFISVVWQVVAVMLMMVAIIFP